MKQSHHFAAASLNSAETQPAVHKETLSLLFFFYLLIDEQNFHGTSLQSERGGVIGKGRLQIIAVTRAVARQKEKKKTTDSSLFFNETCFSPRILLSIQSDSSFVGDAVATVGRCTI